MKKEQCCNRRIGITKQAKSLDTNTIQICVEAVQRALEDAGMNLAEVDGIAARWPASRRTNLIRALLTGQAYLDSFRWVGDTYPQGVGC